jgi:alpha/beta superfamily hydrolase
MQEQNTWQGPVGKGRWQKAVGKKAVGEDRLAKFCGHNPNALRIKSMAALRTFFLEGPAGRLEALLNEGHAESKFCALVCHPHPKGGGTMHNKVVYHAMKALQGLGLPVLRFNFRGVGRSAGTHDAGQGEQDDVRAALDWLTREFARPIFFAGFSFGSAVGMRVCCPDPRVPAMAALGLPVAHDLRTYEYPWLASCDKPKLFISGGMDEYGPREGLEKIVQLAAGQNELVWVPGADHFFQSLEGPKLAVMQSALREWVAQRLSLHSTV